MKSIKEALGFSPKKKQTIWNFADDQASPSAPYSISPSISPSAEPPWWSDESTL